LTIERCEPRLALAIDADIWVQSGTVMTGGFNHDLEGTSGATVPYQQVFAYRFGEDPQQPFRATDPGFNSAPVLTPSYRLTISIESGLRFWDGSGAPSFSAVTGDVELNLRNRLANWNLRVGASAGPPSALVVQTIPSNRQVHRHIDTTIGSGGGGESFGTPGAADGIYVFSARMGLDPGTPDQPQIAPSLPIYYVYSVGGSPAARDAARDYFRDIAIGTATLSLAADNGDSPTDGITTDGRISVNAVHPRATKEFSVNGGTTWSPLDPSMSFVATPGTYPAGTIRVRQTISDHHGSRSTVGSNAAPMTVLAGDTTPPTVTIASNRPALAAGQTATIAFTLSEPATGFTAADVVVSGGTLSGFSGSGTSYTATFTPLPNSVTPGTITIAAGAFTDAAGNPNNSASLSIPIEQAASDVVISRNSIPENAPAGTLVGRFSPVDSAPTDGFAYALVAGQGATDNHRFTITGDELRAKETFDYETLRRFTIRVEWEDARGLRFQKAFAIDVTNVAERPRIASVILPEARVYRKGERISWTIVTTESVTVTGRPFLTIRVAGRFGFAHYVSGSGTSQLTFSYLVSGRDNSSRVWYASFLSAWPGSRIRASEALLPLRVPGGNRFAPGVSIDSRPRRDATLSWPPMPVSFQAAKQG
jgi:hypothetical protein